MPAAEADIMLIDKGLHYPGWEHSLGQGLPLREIPPGCEASTVHVIGSFQAPSNAPVVSSAVSKVALVVQAGGLCTTEAGGVKYLTDPATGRIVWVLLGSFVTLPPVPGLASLPRQVWSPVYEDACTAPWVQYAGSLLAARTVPGC
jgi:hypothetical protein